MAVLIEVLSLVIRVDRVQARFPGGWAAFQLHVQAHPTFCADGELARLGFMHPGDVEALIRDLRGAGLRYVVESAGVRRAEDMVVVDQNQGPMVAADWLEFYHVDTAPDGSQPVAVARLQGSTETRTVFPAGWRWEGSMSRTAEFVHNDKADETVTFVRSEDGLDVYRDNRTGELRYIGRRRT